MEAWLRPRLRRGPSGRAASVVFADKGWRGARPLHVMTLEDRVLYRALVGLIKNALPERLRSREPVEQFRTAPLDIPDARYISKTDVTAYYEFVDHELLCAELTAQTGEELAVESLADLLASVIGRRVGLPQVHPSSDVLGDTYIDPVRRRLLRRGHATFTYSDDFRIASRSLGEARASLEACAMEVHALGLVLNERKTYTYRTAKYRESLTSFADAERRLFEEGESPDTSGGLGFLDPGYGDADGDGAAQSTLGTSPVDSSVDEDDAFTGEDDEVAEDVDPRRVQAAQRAWELWEEEDESEEAQAGQDAAITQSLLGRALSTLGAADDSRPLKSLSALLRYEPALTPQVAAYIDAYGRGGRRARTEIRSALDKVVNGKILSTWQGIWLAHAAGGVKRATQRHDYEDWLGRCVADGHDGLAATAAASLGRIGRGDVDLVAAAVDRVGPEWHRLAFWGLIGLDRARAESTADDELDRMLLAEAAEQ
ncbi:reverse transcriptase domain-containing protein [Micromonospora sp. NPDC007271]|uniref:reverse transcriptase domain-containing protein n=1 Tax=Micromonospora sp. NPDC007271 TaxID=3154587 RepID=UPI0033C12A50